MRAHGLPDPQVLTMLAKVTNYGYGRKTFPTRIGNIYLERLMPFDVDDKGVLDDLKVFEQSDKLGFEILEPSRPEAPVPSPQKFGYDGYRINELRSIAVGKGIKGVFRMRKVDLIQILEDKHGTSI